MSKNNKGFTMIELVACIIILGVILLIAVPGVSRLMRQFRLDYYSKLEQSITEAAKEFYSDNKIYKPDGLLKSSYVNVTTLVSKSYISEVVDYKGKTCAVNDKESYSIVIYKGNNNYEYKTCLKCLNDDYTTTDEDNYCDPAWLTNDNISYDFGTKEGFYIYYNTPREEVREKLLIGLNVVKMNSEGEELERVLANNGQENILPSNIDELDTTPVLDDTNKKEFILKYTIEDTEEELTATVYKHKAPKVTITNANGEAYTGGWTNRITIRLEVNDNFFELTDTTVKHYEWYQDGRWEPIVCTMATDTTCTISLTENINGTYKFRLVTSEDNISDETGEFSIQVDVTKPTVTLSPNGSEFNANSDGSTVNIVTTITTNDSGGSGISTKGYAISTDNQTPPSTFIPFDSPTINISENKPGGIYYIWVKVIDNAGNESTDAWPSNAFMTKYQVVYDANGGTNAPNTQYKLHNEALKLTTDKPTKAGYSFAGWNTSSSGSGVTYSSGADYTENKSIKLYAVWEGNDYTVTYDANGGSVSPTSQSANYNTAVTLPTPTRTGYTFSGWYTTATGGTKIGSAGSSYTVTSNITLYAHWTINSYTVTYDANGGSVSPTSQSTNYNTTVTLPTPTRINYVFVGWYTSSTGGTKVGESESSYTVTSNITLYARWTQSSYTINYEPNGGSGTMRATICEYGVECTLSSNSYYKTGYTFSKWVSLETSNSYYNGAKVTNLAESGGTANLIAQWTINSYKVTYSANGGSVSPTSQTTNYNTSVVLPTPTRTGYTFSGWYTTATGGTKVGNAGSSYTVTSNITLYAHWTINSYTVTYYANGGSVSPTSQSANYNTSVVLPTPTQVGYTFNGWYTASANGTKVGNAGASYTVTSNITLYAQWTLTEADHTHDSKARSSTQISDTRSRILSYYGVNEHDHWCTSSNTTESCFPSDGIDPILMYEVTCSICGAHVGGKWCPVHAAGGNAVTGGGGKSLPICDAETKTYSSDATNCIGKDLGWTLVSK